MNYYAIPQGTGLTWKQTLIIAYISERYNHTIEEIKSKRRFTELVFVRHLLMYALKVEGQMRPADIGRYFGVDHTTVLHACKMINNYIETDSLDKRAEILGVIHAIKKQRLKTA